MKILYGVCGEGFGHSSRAKEIITHLKKKHKILIITYGQAYPILKPLKTKILKIQGIHLYFKNNKLSLTKTTTQSLKSLSKNLINLKKINSAISNFNPDICISDMEPLVPIISHWKKLPLISIDNQHRLTHTKINIPKEYHSSYKLAKLIVNICLKKANAFIILSFTKNKVNSTNSFIVSPILRKEIISLKPKTSNFILVYLTKPNPNLIKILKILPKYNFVIYTHENQKNKNNLIFKKPSSSFLKDLSNCKAIIASSGFTLISEALYLKKPYFAIPLKGQFEQTLNALFLKNSKLGTYSEKPTKNQIQHFLKNLPKYKSKLKNHKLNPSEAIITLDKILKNIQTQKL